MSIKKQLIQMKSSSEETRPEVVRVFGRNYYILYPSSDMGITNLGLTHFEEAIINIRDGQQSVEEKDTVLHEVLHVLDRVMETDLDEKQVTVLAHGLIGIFQDNPEFAKYIIEKVNV